MQVEKPDEGPKLLADEDEDLPLVKVIRTASKEVTSSTPKPDDDDVPLVQTIAKENNNGTNAENNEDDIPLLEVVKKDGTTPL